MLNWITVAKTSELAVSCWKVVTVENTSIALFNLHGEYFALENICTHDGSPLAGEPIEDEQVICPRHGASFCIRTGKVLTPPAYEDATTFPVRVVNDEIQIQI